MSTTYTPKYHHLDRRAHRLLEELPTTDDDQLMTTQQVADLLCVSIQWLEIGRSRGNNYGPPFKRLSPRMVRYRRGDLRTWLESRQREAA